MELALATPVQQLGNEKPEPPVYDYAKFFQQEQNDTENANQALSKRTPVMWEGRMSARGQSGTRQSCGLQLSPRIAILGAVALRSMKSATAS